jgi:hypothetical protein
MKKISLKETIEKVNDNFSSVFTKEDVISLLSGIKPEPGLTEELAERIQNQIEQCVDRNIDDLVNYDNIGFEINRQNQIEAVDVSINTYDLMGYIGSIMSEYVIEEDEEEVNDDRVESDGYIKLAKINYVYNRTTETPQAEIKPNPTQIEIGMKYQCKDLPELGYVVPKAVDEEQDDIRFENYTNINYVISGGLVIFSLKLFSEYFELKD